MDIEIDKQSNAESDHEVVAEKCGEPRRKRKRGATISWKELVQSPKHERGRPRLLGSGSVGRPR